MTANRSYSRPQRRGAGKLITATVPINPSEMRDGQRQLATNRTERPAPRIFKDFHPMRRLLCTVTLLLGASTPQAHSIWALSGKVALAKAPSSARDADANPSQKGDPEAVKLFEEARLARAHWKNFPGFSADVSVSVGAKSGSGKLTIGADYKLTFTGLEKDVEEAARKELTSVVGHRKDTSAEPTPAVVFDTAAGDSALGRAIRVVGDKNSSGYRIRNKQLTVTQRTMPTQRFVILALENVKNAEGKYLPASHVVQYFDNTTGKLVRSDSNFHSWTRVGVFDLPATAIKMMTPGEMPADKIGPQALRITLTNHKLLTKE